MTVFWFIIINCSLVSVSVSDDYFLVYNFNNKSKHNTKLIVTKLRHVICNYQWVWHQRNTWSVLFGDIIELTDLLRDI